MNTKKIIQEDDNSIFKVYLHSKAKEIENEILEITGMNVIIEIKLIQQLKEVKE